MKCLLSAILLTSVLGLAACGTPGPATKSAGEFARQVDVSLSPESRETLLIVSLDDGSVIMQTIHSTADICFKKNSDSATTCLTQGAPVYDPATNGVIGFEMIEEHIDLVAKSH